MSRGQKKPGGFRDQPGKGKDVLRIVRAGVRQPYLLTDSDTLRPAGSYDHQADEPWQEPQ